MFTRASENRTYLQKVLVKLGQALGINGIGPI